MKKTKKIPVCNDCIPNIATIFRSLTPDEMESLLFERTCQIYKKGSILFHEGHHINGFYCIFSGVVKLYKTGMEGREQIIRFAKEGDIIGYRAVLSHEKAGLTAKIIDDATACFIPASILLALLKSNTQFALDLMELTCKELGDANKFIIDIAQKTVRERLAEVLVILKDTFGLDNYGILQISLTREELANIVGTATESVIRLLSEFKADKLIELNGRKIRFLDVRRIFKTANLFN